MTTLIATVSLADAAFILRAKLGPLRAWADFLVDNIRGRQDLRGLTLMPVARKKDGRAMRPVYALKDIRAFIASVLASDPAAGSAAVTPMTLAIDTTRGWRLNKFERDGTPSARLCGAHIVY